MNLFDQHSKENEIQAKAALMSVGAKVIGKYVVCQQLLNKSLSGGGKSSKNGKCLICQVSYLTAKMAKLEMQVGQLTKTWKLLFNEEMDVRSITEDATNEFYPMTTAKSKGKTSIPKGARVLSEEERPEEIQQIITAFTDSLRKIKGDDFTVHVMEVPKGSTMPSSTFGINPDDFDSFEDFFDAVQKAKKDSKASGHTQYDGKTGEAIINEAVMHKAEDESKDPKAPKGGKKGDSDDKSKMN